MKQRQRLGEELEDRIALMAPARRLRLALADELATDHSGGAPIRLLDVGCGDGLLSLSIAKRHPDWQVVGVDLRENLLESARARAGARGLSNVSFRAADITQPLALAGFDVVLALECLAEIGDDRAALGSMAAALAPGGTLVVHVPERGWAPVLPGSSATWRDELRHGYGAEELSAALTAAGLDRVEVRPTYHAIAMAAQEVRDRVKHWRPAARAPLFPLMAMAVRLERWGLRPGRANALLATARRPYG